MCFSAITPRDPNGAVKPDTTPEAELKPITLKQLEPFLGRPAIGTVFVQNNPSDPLRAAF